MTYPPMTNTSQPGARYPVGVARERVRELVGKGLSARDIARVLGVSVQAVQYHRRSIAKEAKAS